MKSTTHEHVDAHPHTSPTLLQIWAAGSRSTAEASGTGAVARLHSALIAVLTHLLSRLYAAATQHEQIREVLLPLLLAALDENSPEHEVLLEDGLHLLQALLAGSSSINEGLQVRGASAVKMVLLVLVDTGRTCRRRCFAGSSSTNSGL